MLPNWLAVCIWIMMVEKNWYLAESYVTKLVGCTYLEDYDGGKKPICNERCWFGCQAFFRNQMEVIREYMIEWWGEYADPTLRRGLIYEDIKLGTEVDEDGTLKPQRWFIRKKQVCRNFYMRAWGAQKETVRRLAEEISSDCSYLGAVKAAIAVYGKPASYSHGGTHTQRYWPVVQHCFHPFQMFYNLLSRHRLLVWRDQECIQRPQT